MNRGSYKEKPAHENGPVFTASGRRIGDGGPLVAVYSERAASEAEIEAVNREATRLLGELIAERGIGGVKLVEAKGGASEARPC